MLRDASRVARVRPTESLASEGETGKTGKGLEVPNTNQFGVETPELERREAHARSKHVKRRRGIGCQEGRGRRVRCGWGGMEL